MLTITDRAGAVLRATIGAADQPMSGVRLSPASPPVEGDGSARVLRVDLVQNGAIDDEMVEAPGGAAVFVDSEVVPWVTDKVLDASIDDEGRTSLVILGGAEDEP
jgi:Fe-S cluster assembly iron-binding protein IscA